MTKISVLMPAYNAERFILASVNSIINQTLNNFELLICDDCSTDSTYKLLLGLDDHRIRLFRNKQNIGYLQTCNMLAKLADGDFITFQDADDLASPERFEKLLVTLHDKNWDLVGSNVSYIDEYSELLGRSYYAIDVTQTLLCNVALPFCGSSVLCKKSVIAKIGLYDEAFDRIGAEDHDWLYRAAFYFKLGNIETPLYSYRMHVNSVSTFTSSVIPSQIFSEYIATQMFIIRKNGNLMFNSQQFVNEQKKYWSKYLSINPTKVLLKQATTNALAGRRLLNFKIIFKLLKCPSTLKIKLRSTFLVLVETLVGFSGTFKLKTFYKKLFYKLN
jgi:glycosyltransferase involved in cell wall biosynthesis